MQPLQSLKAKRLKEWQRQRESELLGSKLPMMLGGHSFQLAADSMQTAATAHHRMHRSLRRLIPVRRGMAATALPETALQITVRMLLYSD